MNVAPRTRAQCPLKRCLGHRRHGKGVVESFALTGHPKAARCYAWGFNDSGETRYVGVLELPPVDSPQTTVRAAIASGQQK